MEKSQQGEQERLSSVVATTQFSNGIVVYKNFKIQNSNFKT